MSALALSLADALRGGVHLYAPPPPPPSYPPSYIPPPGTTPPPAYHGGGMNEQHPNAVLMLILAIVGITGMVTTIPGVVAFFMAKNALTQYPNCGMTKAAYWLGLVCLILTALALVAVCLWIGYILFMLLLVAGSV